jgi:hypothetical protein
LYTAVIVETNEKKLATITIVPAKVKFWISTGKCCAGAICPSVILSKVSPENVFNPIIKQVLH